MSVDAAAAQLNLTPLYVRHLVQHGGLGEQRDGVWVANAASVCERRAECEEWVSFGEAARVVGCAISTISYHARTGHIEQRPITSTGRPSLRRSAVHEFARQRAAALAVRAEQSERPRPNQPPDDGHVWLDTVTVALMLGVSDSRVRQLACQGRLPFVHPGRRRWFRRDHIEVIAAARALRGRPVRAGLTDSLGPAPQAAGPDE
jgi:excisionase family DNA binding protein